MSDPIYVPGGLTIPRSPPHREKPTLSSITPTRDDSNGGTAVRIFGTNLRRARAVFIGGALATIVDTADTYVDAITGPRGVGSLLDVVVVALGGAATLEGAFTYALSAANISGLAWWLRADLGTTLGEVVGWNDQSGSGDANRNLVKENVAGPTFIASDPDFGNKPSIDFSTGNLSMPGLWDDAPVAQPFTLIIVGKDNAGDGEHFSWIGDADVNEWYMASCPLTPELTGTPHFISTTGVIPDTDVELQSTTLDVNQPVVWMYEFSDPNSSTMRINSQTPEVLIQRGGSGAADSGIPTLKRLAFGWAFGTGAELDGKIAEIIIVDGILSASDRAAVITYLGARYSISIAGAPGATIADPSDLPGLRLWLRADKGVTARVSTWADQSDVGDGNRNVANATRLAQPRRVANDPDFANKPTLHFDSEFLDMVGLWSDAPITQPYTLVVVGKDSVAGVENFLGAKSANAWYMTSEAGFYKIDVVVGLSSTTPDSTSPKILVFEYRDAGSHTTIRVNAATPEAEGNTSTGNLPALELGGNQQGQRPLHGAIAEVLMFHRILSGGEMASLLAYLGDRYGITVGA